MKKRIITKILKFEQWRLKRKKLNLENELKDVNKSLSELSKL